MVAAPETQQAALGDGVAPVRPRPGVSPSPSPAQNNGGVHRRKSSFFGSIKASFNKGKAGSSSVIALVETMAAPPPPAGGDGLRPVQARAPSDSTPAISLSSNLWAQVKSGRVAEDAATLLQTATSAVDPLDDREMLLENLVTMLQNQPTDSPIQRTLTDKFITVLWGDLQHPPSSYTGPAYRAADGSGNNPINPLLGAAGTPYARSVAPCHPKNPQLPSPEVVFDALLKRDSFKPHPSGISSLLFSFATIIIHSAFQTSREDATINEASSYLDLSPLYGNNEAEQKTVRTFEQGKLFPDVIASSRLFFMPPSVVALLVIFNRNHNYIVEHLFKINERGEYKPWDQLDEAGKARQDRDLFEKGRLINCGHFLNIVVRDYIRVILNLNRTASGWSLAPNTASRSFPNGWTPRGVGNSCSAEFNLVYRWHAAISQKDERWIEDLFKEKVGDKPIDELTETDFIAALRKLAKEQGTDPRNWSIPGIERTASGSFRDEDLCKILTEATDEVAGAFGALGSPAVMRIIDVLGMATARDKWNVASMNEFRNFLHLKPFDSFEEWNSDPLIADRACRLYGHIDNLELFPGLHAEEAKPSRTGSGLAANYTITRAILSDAVALVRGDRFFTTDYHAGALTSWGFEDVQPDLEGGSFGGCIGKLLMRNLPRSYSYNSIYALFPFSTPTTTKEILTNLHLVDQYDFSTPKPAPAVHGVFSYKGVTDVLADSRRFTTVAYDEPIKNCSNQFGYFISVEGNPHKVCRQLQAGALFPDGWQQELKAYYRALMADLVAEKSWSYDGGKTKIVDVVRDVTNLAAVFWTAHQFGIPLKTQTSPHGIFTPQELYLVLSAFFISVFMNFDLSSSLKLRSAAKKAAPALLAIIRMRISQVKGIPAVLDHLARHVQDLLLDKSAQGVVMGKAAHAYYERLLKKEGVSLEQLESSVQSTMTASVSNQGQAAAHAIEFFLDERNAAHKEELIKLCKLNTPEADVKILALCREAARFDPQAPFCPRTATEDCTVEDGDRIIKVKKGDLVFPSIKRAGMDPTVFPDPSRVDTSRDPSLYRTFGHGAHTCLGAPVVDITVVEMLRAVFSLKNVRRAPGPAGRLVRFQQDVAGTSCPVYLSANTTPWPLPVSLSIVYDN
ncbi:hypothetical protein JCM10213_008418 [Rhodosporidiobolus nylandii]